MNGLFLNLIRVISLNEFFVINVQSKDNINIIVTISFVRSIIVVIINPMHIINLDFIFIQKEG